MRPDLDVLVVGGGPVGLVAALEVCSRGMSVAVVEPRRGPVDKACGEGLMPGAVRELSRLGVHVGGLPFVGIRYVGMDGSTTASHRFGAGHGRGVRRTELSGQLRAAVAAAGVTTLTGRVVRVIQDGARVRALVSSGRGEPVPVDASWLLACDGLHSAVRAQLGLDAGTDGRRYGVRRHAAVAPWTDHVEVHWSAGAEAYVTPVGPHEVGVALLGPRRLAFDEALRGFPALSDRLGKVAWATDPRGAGPLRQRVSRRVHGRVLLVGDAAGYVDALTGEGMRVGFASARAAAESLAVQRPEVYEHMWVRESRTYRWTTQALLAATRRALLRKALVPTAARFPRVYGAVVDTLAT